MDLRNKINFRGKKKKNIKHAVNTEPAQISA